MTDICNLLKIFDTNFRHFQNFPLRMLRLSSSSNFADLVEIFSGFWPPIYLLET